MKRCSYRLKVRIQDLQSCDAVAESAGSANEMCFKNAF